MSQPRRQPGSLGYRVLAWLREQPGAVSVGDCLAALGGMNVERRGYVFAGTDPDASVTRDGAWQVVRHHMNMLVEDGLASATKTDKWRYQITAAGLTPAALTPGSREPKIDTSAPSPTPSRSINATKPSSIRKKPGPLPRQDAKPAPSGVRGVVWQPRMQQGR